MAAKPGMKFVSPSGKGGDEKPPEKKPKRFDWREARYRILVTPRSGYSISVPQVRRTHTTSGVVMERSSIPFNFRVISGGERDHLGFARMKIEGTPDPGAAGDFRHSLEGREGTYHELPESTHGMSLETGVIGAPSLEIEPKGPEAPLSHYRRFPLYGAQFRIDQKIVDEMEETLLGIRGEDWPEDPFERLVHWIENRRRPFTLYGKKYAFLDDEAGMEKLLPQFLEYVKKVAIYRDDQDEIFRSRNISGSEVGPPLSQLEPGRFERHPEHGYLW